MPKFTASNSAFTESERAELNAAFDRLADEWDANGDEPENVEASKSLSDRLNNVWAFGMDSRDLVDAVREWSARSDV